jgi:hypothetical protein
MALSAAERMQRMRLRKKGVPIPKGRPGKNPSLDPDDLASGIRPRPRTTASAIEEARQVYERSLREREAAGFEVGRIFGIAQAALTRITEDDVEDIREWLNAHPADELSLRVRLSGAGLLTRFDELFGSSP